MSGANQIKAPKFGMSFQALAVAKLFTAPCDVRRYLQGILVLPLKSGGLALAATDGHSIVTLRDPGGYSDRPFLFSPDLETCKIAQRYARLRPKKGDDDSEAHPHGVFSNGVRCTAKLDGDEIYVQPLPRVHDPYGLPAWEIDMLESFPNVARVFPEALFNAEACGIRSSMRYCYRPEYIKRLYAALACIQKTGDFSGLHFFTAKEDSMLMARPISTATPSIVTDVLMGVMALNCDATTTDAIEPDWLREIRASGGSLEYMRKNRQETTHE